MRKKIHPKYHSITVTCSTCGNTFVTGSTQKDIHVQNLTSFIELLEAENKRDQFIVIIGGARINHGLAKELGYDAGFGSKKYAFDVASFAVQALKKKQVKIKLHK